jgi:hypothetical protein
MTGLPELTRALAVVSVIADAAKTRKDELRGEILGIMKDLGAASANATLPDGTAVGKASAVEGKPKAVVLSEDLLAEYVQQDSPSEVVLRVREAYRRALLERLVPGPDGSAVDPETGVIVPGVRFGEGSAYVSMRFAKDGRENVLEALKAGQVSLDITARGEIES